MTEAMRSVRHREPPRLPERVLDIFELEQELDGTLKERYPQGGLKAIVYDDSARALAEARRQLQQNAAGTAQRVLPVLNELLRLAGNATWNSPAGTGDVGVEITDDIVREWLEVTRDLDTLRMHAHAYKSLVEQGVADNLKRRERA